MERTGSTTVQSILLYVLHDGSSVYCCILFADGRAHRMHKIVLSGTQMSPSSECRAKPKIVITLYLPGRGGIRGRKIA